MTEPPLEPDAIQKAVDLMIDALITDGAHHKQWYLEQALEALGVDLNRLADELGKPDKVLGATAVALLGAEYQDAEEAAEAQ